MRIQQSYSPNLDRPEVYAFLRGPSATWSEPVPQRVGYSVSNAAPKSAGSITESEPGKPTVLVWAIREWYEVSEGSPGQVVGTFDIIVPVEQEVSIEVKSVLLVKSGIATDLQEKIEDWFTRYTYPADGDPVDFARAAMVADPTITKDAFEVVLTCIVTKIGPGVTRDERKKELLAVYEDRADGEVVTSPAGQVERLSDGGYFAKRALTKRRIKEEFLDQIPPLSQDPIHQVPDPTKSVSGIVNDIVGIESPNICDGVTPKQWRILTLASWPEFRVIWRDFSVDIGCGITVILRLPVLQIKISELNLYVYAGIPNDYLVPALFSVVKACAWRAALAGAVVGVVVANLAGALAAFRGVFEQCIKEKLLELVDCMTPGLLMITETQPGQDWH